MKRLKEFIIFPIAFIAIIGLFIAMFFILVPDDGFFSNGEYLKLMIKDELFLSAMVTTFGIPLIASFAGSVISTLVMLIIRWKKKIDISRKNYFLTLAVISTAVSFGYFALFTGALNKTAELNTSVQMGIFAFIFAVIISVVIVFIFWLFELFISLIKRFVNKMKENKNGN